MDLATFFRTISPFLLGRSGHAETAQALYGAQEGPDARRLSIYGRFCRAHRQEALTGVYPYCHEVVTQGMGQAAWEKLVEDFFFAHPMRSFELNENGAALPAFLADDLCRPGRPAFLPELADFEWWQWQTQIAEDQSGPARTGGPLRLDPTVELRRYAYDFVSWLDTTPRPPRPDEGECFVLFWRDPSLRTRWELCSQRELLVLQMIHEGLSRAQMARQARERGLARKDLTEILSDLQEAGIVR